MDGISKTAATLNEKEQKRLNNMLLYFAEKKSYSIRITLLDEFDLIELIDKKTGNVLSTGRGLILDRAIDDLIIGLNKVGFL